METAAIYAFGAAICWTLAGLFGHAPARALGSLHFNRLRMIAAAGILAVLLVITGRDLSFDLVFIWPLILSSVIGIVLGDFFLFLTMRRLGPRRTNILFTSNAPMTAILGWLILGEVLAGHDVVAVIIAFIGICLAIIYGKHRDLIHVWEDVTPPLSLGVLFGLLAALGQAISAIIIRPVMSDGMDPVMASLIRVMIAALFFWATYPFDNSQRKKPILPEPKILVNIFFNGLFGLGVGMALFLKALETGHIAIVAILTATTPVLILPFVWARTGMMPAWGAWIGAVLVVACASLLIF
ncbi:DMT family transporter [Candidatus Puniceispirillum sp.]|uniref:DMT family transporter n=1 Tax=Candidatus Puniceispirillum sp. TaxID=2026719 RepID=UPI003F6A0625